LKNNVPIQEGKGKESFAEFYTSGNGIYGMPVVKGMDISHSAHRQFCPKERRTRVPAKSFYKQQ